jgi:hypothetical protein
LRTWEFDSRRHAGYLGGVDFFSQESGLGLDDVDFFNLESGIGLDDDEEDEDDEVVVLDALEVKEELQPRNLTDKEAMEMAITESNLVEFSQ